MNDWVVEVPSFEENLMNNRVIMLNQKGVNRVVEIIKEKNKGIERLNAELELYKDNQTHLNNLLEQKENIIKKVREYIESYDLEYLHEATEHNLADTLEELLKILDKENKNE